MRVRPLLVGLLLGSLGSLGCHLGPEPTTPAEAIPEVAVSEAAPPAVVAIEAEPRAIEGRAESLVHARELIRAWQHDEIEDLDPQRLLLGLCESDYEDAGESCRALGEWLRPDAEAERGAYERGCELGDMPSCVLAAQMHHKEYQLASAGALYEQACVSGETDGCEGLIGLIAEDEGYVYPGGGLGADDAELLERLCGEDYGEACLVRGLSLRGAASVAMLGRACELRVEVACYHGVRASEDEYSAYELWTTYGYQCDRGIDQSCERLEARFGEAQQAKFAARAEREHEAARAVLSESLRREPCGGGWLLASFHFSSRPR